MVYEALEASEGMVDVDSAMSLLSTVARSDTQWSVVYDQTSGGITVAMGRDYATLHEFDSPLP